MIIINTDIISLMQRLNIPESRMMNYGTKTVAEIIEAEAEQGNDAAVKFAVELFTNPDKLVKIFKLADPNNKLEILKEMSESQLQLFLPLMEENDLTQGLKYFTQDKLLKMLEKVPPEQLVKTVFQMFSPDEIINYMPEDQLNKFLTDTQIDKNKVLKDLEAIPPAYIAQMIEAVTGQEVKDMSMDKMIAQLEEFNPLDFKNAMLAMQPVAKQQLTYTLAQENPELYQIFDAHAYTNMIHTYKQQPEMVKAMDVLEPEEKIKMLKELPSDLLSIVITQIDARDFAEILIDKCPEILAQIVAR